MEQKIEELTAKLDEAIRKIELSHTAISGTSSEMWLEIKEIKKNQEGIIERENETFSRFQELLEGLRTEIQPVIDTYRAFAKGREIVVGLGSVVLAIGAIGSAVIYVIKKSTGL